MVFYFSICIFLNWAGWFRQPLPIIDVGARKAKIPPKRVGEVFVEWAVINDDRYVGGARPSQGFNLIVQIAKNCFALSATQFKAIPTRIMKRALVNSQALSLDTVQIAKYAINVEREIPRVGNTERN